MFLLSCEMWRRTKSNPIGSPQSDWAEGCRATRCSAKAISRILASSATGVSPAAFPLGWDHARPRCNFRHGRCAHLTPTTPILRAGRGCIASWTLTTRKRILPRISAAPAVIFSFAVFGDGLVNERIRELDERKEAYFRDSFSEKFVAVDVATELIDSLAADGFRIAVGSSSAANVSLCLEKLGCAAKVSAIVTGQDVTRGKPDPAVFLMAAERLGVSPSNCVVVEDAVHGIEAANAAGMKSVALSAPNPRPVASRAAHCR